jgi:arylsulfatase A-like enzyme
MSTRINRRQLLKSLSLLPLIPLVRHLAREPMDRDRSAAAQGAPNVLIFVFDTLSAQHMSVHGYRRDTTPRMAQFAEQATVFHRHYAGGNFTSPGTASLLTGTYPWSHRAFNMSSTVIDTYKDKSIFRPFFQAGYTTIAYTHNVWADFFLEQFQRDMDVYLPPEAFCFGDQRYYPLLPANDRFLLYQAFSDFLFSSYNPPGSLFLSMPDRAGELLRQYDLYRRYKDEYPRGVTHTEQRMDYFFDDAIEGIKTTLLEQRHPIFGYFHFWPPHSPYSPSQEFIGRFDDGWSPPSKPTHFFSLGATDETNATASRKYDEFIAFADAGFGKLMDFLSETGLLDNSYVVVTSDHGEMFERGIFFHLTPVLYEPLIHIPLLISKPGQRQRKDVYQPTSCVDLLPTLLQAVGQPSPDWHEGRILPTFGSESRGASDSVFAVEAKLNAKRSPLTKATLAMIKGRYKLIHYMGYEGYQDRYELYDLVDDPEELADLYASKSSLAAELQAELKRTLEAAPPR